MKCYLEQIGILDADNKINMDRAIEMTWSNSEDAIVDCKAEMGKTFPLKASCVLRISQPPQLVIFVNKPTFWLDV
jgi:hypothetical protein